MGPASPRDGAVSLFIERARAASSGFDPDAPGVRESVQRICRWLDGMPLAIELAAARVPVLSLQHLAARLELDSGVLRNPGRLGAGAPPHARVDARMEPPDARARRAAPVPPAQRVPGVFLARGRGERLRRLPARRRRRARPARGPDRSLPRAGRRPYPEEPRYRLLATVRQYAAAKLWDGPEGPTVHSRHAEYFWPSPSRRAPGSPARSSPDGSSSLEVEHDNLEAALQWLSEESIDDGARLSRLLWPFWYQRGYYREARTRFEHLLTRAQESPRPAARGSWSAPERSPSSSAIMRGRDEHLSAALGWSRHSATSAALPTALQRLGSIAREQARYDDARDLHERSLAIWHELGDEGGIAVLARLPRVRRLAERRSRNERGRMRGGTGGVQAHWRPAGHGEHTGQPRRDCPVPR